MQNLIIFFDFGKCGRLFDHSPILFGRFGKDLPAEVNSAIDGLTEVRPCSPNERGFDFERFVAFCELGQAGDPHAEFVPEWSDIFRANESIGDLILALKEKGYPLYLGSNTNILHTNHYRRQPADTSRSRDGLALFSREVATSSPASFPVAVLTVAPPSLNYLIDLEENVAGAIAAGLRGIVYRDTESLIRDLRVLGIDVPVSQS